MLTWKEKIAFWSFLGLGALFYDSPQRLSMLSSTHHSMTCSGKVKQDNEPTLTRVCWQQSVAQVDVLRGS